MLQQHPSQYEAGAQPVDLSKYLSLEYLWGLVRRRFLLFAIPFVVIAVAGVTLIMMIPALYVSEGKILVESQRIPTELVRPTVNSLATERIQLIEQRLMARDNVITIIEKYRLFPERRGYMANSELVELMRERTRIQPVESTAPRSGADRVAVSFSVAFEYEKPDTAARVAGELVTRILSEDLRNRAGRANETTKFLEREVSRLQGEYNASENQLRASQAAKAADQQASRDRRQQAIEKANAEIGTLKAERLAKANRLSFAHPEVQAIQRRIQLLEATNAQPSSPSLKEEGDVAVETTQARYEALRKNLEEASQKLAAARLGEALERDQQAERFEVIEQPSQPSKAAKPNRPKLLALALGVAAFAGLALAGGSEFFDSTIRSRSDLARVVEPHLIAALPYIETRQERGKRRDTFLVYLAVGALLAFGLAAVLYTLTSQVDMSWAQVWSKATRLLSR